MKTDTQMTTLALVIVGITMLTLLFTINGGKHTQVSGRENTGRRGTPSIAGDATSEKASAKEPDTKKPIVEERGITISSDIDNSKEKANERIMAEIFPMSDITVGMGIEEVKERYPDRGFNYPQSYYTLNLNEMGFGCDISSNRFWTGCVVHVKDDKVRTIIYRTLYAIDAKTSKKRDIDGVKEDIKTLFKQLKQQQGIAFEKEVRIYPDGTRNPMYLWRREKDIVVFSYTPIVRWAKDGYFYQVQIFPTEEALKKEYMVATDSVPEDIELWLDVTE